MITNKRIADSLATGLNYIASVQLEGGGFLSYSSKNLRKFTKDKTYQTSFIPSSIACALQEIDMPKAESIADAVVHFLKQQASPNWSFNYWAKDTEEFIDRPYPDDLDDTACALTVLVRSDKQPFSGSDMAHITNLLIAAEEKASGPYRTWLVGKNMDEHWYDVDLAVNANIAYFLQHVGVSLEGLETFLKQKLQTKSFMSSYYPSSHALIYFLSRVFKDKSIPSLKRYILNISWKTPLNAALVLTSKLRIGESDEELFEYILSSQRRDGSWPAEAFCLDPAIANKKYYAGAESLTTALCLEAIWLYKNRNSQKNLSASTVKSKYVQAILKPIYSQIDSLSNKQLRRNTRKRLDKLMTGENVSLITEVPRVVTAATAIEIPSKIVESLARVNVWGLLAYTIQDEFLDEGDLKKDLPIANVAMREIMNTLRATLADNREFQTHANQILHMVDSANMWELSHCRAWIKQSRLTIARLPNYTDYSQLAERSLGHIIAAVGVLYAAGYTRKSVVMKQLETFFRHYLIARQLNDDARDWQEDLLYGHINAVAALLIKNHGKASAISLHLKSSLPRLQNVMWEEVEEKVCKLIRHHLQEAKRAATHFQSDALTALLAPLEANLEKVENDHQKATDFIKNFS